MSKTRVSVKCAAKAYISRMQKPEQFIFGANNVSLSDKFPVENCSRHGHSQQINVYLSYVRRPLHKRSPNNFSEDEKLQELVSGKLLVRKC